MSYFSCDKFCRIELQTIVSGKDKPQVRKVIEFYSNV